MVDLAVGSMSEQGIFQPLGAPGGDLRDGMLRFIVDGVVVEPDWNLGPLVSLLRQLDAAVVRLRRGEHALVRSAIDDERTVPYFYFELDNDGARVRVHELFVTNVPAPGQFLGSVYPIDDAHADELYAHVKEHHAAMTERRLFEAKRDELIDGIIRELTLAIGRVPGWDDTVCVANTG